MTAVKPKGSCAACSRAMTLVGMGRCSRCYKQEWRKRPGNRDREIKAQVDYQSRRYAADDEYRTRVLQKNRAAAKRRAASQGSGKP